MFINIDNKLATHGGPWQRQGHGCCRCACVFKVWAAARPGPVQLSLPVRAAHCQAQRSCRQQDSANGCHWLQQDSANSITTRQCEWLPFVNIFIPFLFLLSYAQLHEFSATDACYSFHTLQWQESGRHFVTIARFRNTWGVVLSDPGQLGNVWDALGKAMRANLNAYERGRPSRR